MELVKTSCKIHIYNSIIMFATKHTQRLRLAALITFDVDGDVNGNLTASSCTQRAEVNLVRLRKLNHQYNTALFAYDTLWIVISFGGRQRDSA